MPWLNRKLLVHYYFVVCVCFFCNEVRNIYRCLWSFLIKKKSISLALVGFEMILKQLISFRRSITCNIQAAVVRKVDNSTHRINPIGG